MFNIKKLCRQLGVALWGVSMVLLPCAARAQEIDTGDTAWLLTSTALVLLMTIPGLALFYGGLVRKVNVLTTTAQSFAVTALIAVLWVVVGYSLAFSNGGAYVGGLSRVLFEGASMDTAFVIADGTPAATAMTIPEVVFMMFQMTFAVITPALITGAFAERMKFSAALWFMGLWSLIVYAPVAHWVWHPEGFLAQKGLLDFAGGTVVHINAGVAGLVAALVLGKRKNYPDKVAPAHNLVLSLVGASLLWVGWFGFNAGSALTSGGRAGMAMGVTMVAAAAACLAWMFVEWFKTGKPSITGMITAAVAGLVAITPASGFVTISGALALGAITGVVCFFACTSIKAALGYDDSLDAFGVHGVGGFLGTILTGVFATKLIAGGDAPIGLIEGGTDQIVTQFIGAGATILWTGIASYIILKVLDKVMGLRVDEDTEKKGLDDALHGEVIE